LAGRASRSVGRCDRRCRPLEQTEELFGNEARPGGIEVAIALRVLALAKKRRAAGMSASPQTRTFRELHKFS
jgi:hypothetical protein